MTSFGRTDRRFARLALLGLTLGCALVADAGCHVFEKLEDCSVDDDCAGAERCHPEGHYCEKLTAVHIGATLGMTGAVAGTSAVILQAMQFAVAQVNAEGGVLGVPLVLDVLDDQGDDDLAAQNARTLASTGVAAIVGPLRSSQMLKAQAETFPAKILHLSPVAGAGALGAAQPNHDRYLFQMITSIRRGSASAIVRYASMPEDDATRTTPACTAMAVLHTDDVTGNDYASSIATLLAKHGGCVTLDVAFPPTLKADYVDEVGQLVAARPDCAAIVALPPTGGAVLREFAKQTSGNASWTKFYWLGTTTLHSDDFLQASRRDKASPTPSFAEGFLGADVDGMPDTGDYADYKFAFNETYGEDPPNLSGYGFDAVIAAALAIEHAGTAHGREAIRNSLYDVLRDGERVPAFGPGAIGDALRAARRHVRLNYQGASGKLEPDDNGVVADPTLIWKVREGAFSPSILHYTEDQTSAIDDLTEPQSCP